MQWKTILKQVFLNHITFSLSAQQKELESTIFTQASKDLGWSEAIVEELNALLPNDA